MTSTTDVSLIEQRQTLRQRLLAQRLLIMRQLGPPSVEGGYPRSMTMRLLTRQPALASRLLLAAAALLARRWTRSRQQNLLRP